LGDESKVKGQNMVKVTQDELIMVMK